MIEIKSLHDAKCIIAEIHNYLLKSLESKDTPLRRRAISLLRELFEHNNYSIKDAAFGETEYVSEQTFPSDYSSRTSKRSHKIWREMWFLWQFAKEDNVICTRIHRHETYRTDEGFYSENVTFAIDFNVVLKKVTYLSKEVDESKFINDRR